MGSELRAVHSHPEKSSGWLVELEATGRGQSTGCTPTTTRSARTTTCPRQVTLSPRQRRRITACRVHCASLRGSLPTPSLDSRSLGTLRTHPQLAYEHKYHLSPLANFQTDKQNMMSVCLFVKNFASLQTDKQNIMFVCL